MIDGKHRTADSIAAENENLRRLLQKVRVAMWTSERIPAWLRDQIDTALETTGGSDSD